MWKLEKYIIDWFQIGYDYIWDRWGVRLGSLWCWMGTLYFMVNYGKHTVIEGISFFAGIIAVAFCILIFVQGMSMNRYQDMGLYRHMNFTAEDARTSIVWRTIRTAILFISVFVLFADIYGLRLPAWQVLFDLIMNVYSYIWGFGLTPMIRDRNTKRFEKKVTFGKYSFQNI